MLRQTKIKAKSRKILAEMALLMDKYTIHYMKNDQNVNLKHNKSSHLSNQAN